MSTSPTLTSFGQFQLLVSDNVSQNDYQNNTWNIPKNTAGWQRYALLNFQMTYATNNGVYMYVQLTTGNDIYNKTQDPFVLYDNWKKTQNISTPPRCIVVERKSYIPSQEDKVWFVGYIMGVTPNQAVDRQSGYKNIGVQCAGIQSPMLTNPFLDYIYQDYNVIAKNSSDGYMKAINSFQIRNTFNAGSSQNIAQIIASSGVAGSNKTVDKLLDIIIVQLNKRLKTSSGSINTGSIYNPSDFLTSQFSVASALRSASRNGSYGLIQQLGLTLLNSLSSGSPWSAIQQSLLQFGLLNIAPPAFTGTHIGGGTSPKYKILTSYPTGFQDIKTISRSEFSAISTGQYGLQKLKSPQILRICFNPEQSYNALSVQTKGRPPMLIFGTYPKQSTGGGTDYKKLKYQQAPAWLQFLAASQEDITKSVAAVQRIRDQYTKLIYFLTYSRQGRLSGSVLPSMDTIQTLLQNIGGIFQITDQYYGILSSVSVQYYNGGSQNRSNISVQTNFQSVLSKEHPLASMYESGVTATIFDR